MTERSSTIVLVAHCVLNVNARVPGLAGYPGVHPVVEELARHGVGIIQLSCPELAHEGLDRQPQALEYYDTPAFRARCATIAEETARLVEAHARAGLRVAAFVGVEGSPSCGVSITNTCAGVVDPDVVSVRTPGSGVLAQELRKALEPLGVAFSAVDGRAEDLGVAAVLRALELD